MHAAEARVESEKAGQYLVQLCKHFAHKTPAEHDGTEGRIDFQPGLCRLVATNTELVLVCEAENAVDLDRVKLIVENHIVRFGWRDNIGVAWTEQARPSTF